MRIVIVNPNGGNSAPFAGIEQPLWAGMIAHFEREVNYHDVTIIDAEADNLTEQETFERVLLLHPDRVIVCVMGKNPSVSSTPKMPQSIRLARNLHGLAHIEMTGIHPLALPQETSDLAQCEITRYQFTGSHPHVAWDLLPMHKYRAHNWQCLDGTPRSPYAITYTSLGCPFQCYYCNIHTLYGNRIMQYRPVNDVLADIDLLVNDYSVRVMKFWDELFALREDRVLDICKELEDRAYGLNIWTYARVDTITRSMLRAMKRAGIKWLCYGFESVSPDVRGRSHKTFDNDMVERAIKMTEDAGISIIGNFMFGLPGDTVDTIKASVDFMMYHLFEYVNIYVALPYPGSQFYEDMRPQTKWEDYDQYGQLPNTVRDMRDKAFKDYFTNPDYLSKLRKKFGGQAVAQIETMLKWDIRSTHI